MPIREVRGVTKEGIARMDGPRITLVTPSYNQGRYLGEAIESVLGQGYDNLEYLVTDGQSQDDSLSVIRRYARHLAWWVSERDHGQAHALNKGFARATGEIFGYLNADDRLAPGALAAVAEAMADGTAWVSGRVRNFDARGTIDVYRYDLANTPWDRWHWLVENPLHQPGTFWRAGLHWRFGPFDESLRYAFDYKMFLRFRLVANTSNPRKVGCFTRVSPVT